MAEPGAMSDAQVSPARAASPEPYLTSWMTATVPWRATFLWSQLVSLKKGGAVPVSLGRHKLALLLPNFK